MSNPRLHGWSVFHDALVGRVFNHPHFRDGENIIVKFKSLDLDKMVAVTKNRIYDLGIPASTDETICAKPDLDSFERDRT